MKASRLNHSHGAKKLLKVDASSNLAELVCQELCHHHQFRYHLDSLSIECQEGTVIITGQLPSFYLKQLLQTVLCTLPDVQKVDNRVDVVSCHGLSSANQFDRRSDSK